MLRDKFKIIKPGIYEMAKEAGMLAPARLYASEKIFNVIEDGAIQQLVNTSYLPGIQKYALALPDAHQGYGLPIGGVAAMDAKEGVVSPGGVGYDINCGVRLVKTNLTEAEIRPKLKELMNELFKEIPAGVGEEGKLRLAKEELDELLVKGAEYAVDKGYGWKQDLQCIEENGCMKNAAPDKVSDFAKKRGRPQTGTLGSGNHFLELQRIDEILDEKTAEAFGLKKGNVSIMIHCGSRGLGHQVASDYINVMMKAMNKYGIKVPDRQLNCAPIESEEGQAYIQAMNCAINYAFANRQMIMHWTRSVFEKVYGRSAEELGMELLYDVCHNIAKFEEHEIDGLRKNVLVNRKGATRAFPAGRV
ncbi:RtcB family protein, partial [archaeon]|nr:RtcB family protein [archaeon]